MAYQLLVLDAGREKIPVVLISGADGIQKIAREVGTPYYVAKPFSLDQLSTTLELALSERKAPQPGGQYGRAV
jgi:DNA-binding NtrC family response regulator